MRSEHVYSLSADRRQPNKLELPTGYVQVVRCDQDATLIHGQGGAGIPALPGTVFHNVKGVWLFHTPTSPDIQPGIFGADSTGVLVLAVYETYDEILPVPAAPKLPTRLLDRFFSPANGVDDLERELPAIPGAIYYITGFGYGYDETPATDGAGFFAQIQTEIATGWRDMYSAIAPKTSEWREVWFPSPLFSTPGKTLRYRVDAANVADVQSFAVIYGGLLYL